MKFYQRNEWYLQSDENYTISKALSEGTPKYTAWAPKAKGYEMLGTKNTAREATQLCANHHNQHRSKAA